MRLGDYKDAKNLKIFSEVSLDYYRNAINTFKKKLNKPIIILFSDQLNKAIDILADIDDLIPSTKLNIISKNDFQLMSMCDSYIFSNSTFSLWSAYLSQKKNIYYIRPNTWFKNLTIENANKYYLNEWVNLS